MSKISREMKRLNVHDEVVQPEIKGLVMSTITVTTVQDMMVSVRGNITEVSRLLGFTNTNAVRCVLNSGDINVVHIHCVGDQFVYTLLRHKRVRK